MFKFLKEKLKSAVSIFSRKAEEETPEKAVEEEAKPLEEKQLIEEEPELEDEGKIEEEIEEKRLLTEEEAEPYKEAEEVKEADEEIEEEPELKAEEQVKEEAQEEKPQIEEETEELKEAEQVPEEEEKIDLEAELETGKDDDIVEEAKEPDTEIKQIEEQLDKKQGFFTRLFRRKEKATEEKPEEEAEEPKAAKKSILSKITAPITTTTISNDKFDELFWSLEVALMENNVAVEVIEKIKEDMKKEIVGKPIKRGDVSGIILKSLKGSLRDILDFDKYDLIEKIRQKKPFVICFVGVNGSGKTTTIAKVAKMAMAHGMSCVIAASDTFRAAAIDQLQKHADALGVRLIKHDYGADPAAVAYDTIEHAKSKHIDCVLIDTAGRLHSNENLLDEMKKIVRVAKPDATIFVGESITGNDCIEQAKKFNEAVDIDGIILAKADVDEKGGAAISVSYVTGKPVLYMGTGQGYDDLEAFDAEKVMGSLGL